MNEKKRSIAVMLLLLPVLPLAYFGITYSFHAYIVIFLYLAACFYCFSRRFKGLAGVLSFNASVSFVIIACVEFAFSGLVFPRPGEMAVVVPEKLPGANEIKSSGIKNTKGIVIVLPQKKRLMNGCCMMLYTRSMKMV